MLIDCDSCQVRDLACRDCVVSVLLHAQARDRPEPAAEAVELDGAEQAAIAVLARSGLVPPLRLVADRQVPVTGPERSVGARGAKSESPRHRAVG